MLLVSMKPRTQALVRTRLTKLLCPTTINPHPLRNQPFLFLSKLIYMLLRTILAGIPSRGFALAIST
jgi:hypothetical protein